MAQRIPVYLTALPRSRFGSTVAFGADFVDPSIVSPHFIQRYYDSHVVGCKPPLAAVTDAFSDYVGRHTDVFLLQKETAARFYSAPYSRPHGIPVICCGQEMEFRKLVQGGRSVKMRCRLGANHPSGVKRTRILPCTPHGTSSRIVHKGRHRFIVDQWEVFEAGPKR